MHFSSNHFSSKNFYYFIIFYIWKSFNLVTKDGKAYALGVNRDKKNFSLLPEKDYKKEIEIHILDSSGHQCNIISAVCGFFYTLYLVSKLDGTKHLVYNYEKRDKPLFVNINGSEPFSLFGGDYLSAAINEEGGIIFLGESLFDSPKTAVEPLFLPEKEKAVFVGFLCKLLIVLSENGQVFMSDPEIKNFHEVEELRYIKIINMSATYAHCIAVSSEGRVFVSSKIDRHSCLGLGNIDIQNLRFFEVASLSKWKITAVYAGKSHSLFQTEEGKILACGVNPAFELISDYSNNDDDINFHQAWYPIETDIESGASFCIAGLANYPHKMYLI